MCLNYSVLLFHRKLKLSKFTKVYSTLQSKSLHNLYIQKSIHKSKTKKRTPQGKFTVSRFPPQKPKLAKNAQNIKLGDVSLSLYRTKEQQQYYRRRKYLFCCAKKARSDNRKQMKTLVEMRFRRTRIFKGVVKKGFTIICSMRPMKIFLRSFCQTLMNAQLTMADVQPMHNASM